MASVTMSATFLGGAALNHFPSPSAPTRRLVVTTRAVAQITNGVEKATQESTSKREIENGRREMIFAAAAAAVCSVAGVAAAEEPARGTKEAKKAYAPVCVTMPTARICHK